jgi:ubiquinone/menaquinone biosynthesis C-methylase UbiE
MPERSHGTGITLNAFHLNTAINHAMFAGRRGRVYDRLVAASGVRPGDAVLDVGSSSGYLTRRMAAVAGPSGHVVGVDPAGPAIAYARRRARPGLAFAVGVAQDLSLPDESFDVVTCTLAMHHIPARDRPGAFAEMYRVTRPGGRLLVADIEPLLAHLGGGRPDAMSLAGLATVAGYVVESTGKLPLLRYLLAVRPRA